MELQLINRLERFWLIFLRRTTADEIPIILGIHYFNQLFSHLISQRFFFFYRERWALILRCCNESFCFASALRFNNFYHLQTIFLNVFYYIMFYEYIRVFRCKPIFFLWRGRYCKNSSGNNTGSDISGERHCTTIHICRTTIGLTYSRKINDLHRKKLSTWTIQNN